MVGVTRLPGSNPAQLTDCRLPCKSFVKRKQSTPDARVRGARKRRLGKSPSAHVCLSAVVPASQNRTSICCLRSFARPSQKIEFVFSASPETIRRRPREIALRRPVGHRQDLAACAPCNPFSPAVGG